MTRKSDFDKVIEACADLVRLSDYETESAIKIRIRSLTMQQCGITVDAPDSAVPVAWTPPQLAIGELRGDNYILLYPQSSKQLKNGDRLYASPVPAKDFVMVPREIDRTKHLDVLLVWNNGMRDQETLEMLWPKLVHAITLAASQQSGDAERCHYPACACPIDKTPEGKCFIGLKEPA